MGEPSVIVALIAAVVAIVQGAITWFTLKDAKKAEVTGSLTDSAMKIVNELQEEVKRLGDKVKVLETAVTERDERIRELEEENAGLRAEITELREKLERMEANHGTK